MRIQIIAAWVGCLALLGPGLATTARAQGQVDERPKLRAAVVKLRTEVEMLGLDQEIDRANLMEDLKIMKGFEMLSGMAWIVNATRQPARPPASAGDAEKQATEARKEAEEKAKYVAEKKAALARRAAVLAEKRLDLEDLERQYRETWQAPRPGDGLKRASFEKTEPGPAALTSSQRIEVCVDTSGSPRVAILDPVPGGSAPCCLDPPTEAEVWAKVTATARNDVFRPNIDYGKIRYEIEKIGEQVEPVKVFPLAGPCQLVHCHYKCTARYEESIGGGQFRPRAVTVYIDKDHLRRAATAAAPPQASQAGADIERRMADMDRKLDRILKALGDPGRGPRD
jgi:hypothetical protein